MMFAGSQPDLLAVQSGRFSDILRFGSHRFLSQVKSGRARLVWEQYINNSLWSLAQARLVIADWKHDYDNHRRHSALGYQQPAHYAASRTHQ
jgi:transposase InsO family protein